MNFQEKVKDINSGYGSFNSFRHPPPPGWTGKFRKKIAPGVGNSAAPRGPPGEFGNQTDFDNFLFDHNFALNVLKWLINGK